MLWGLGRGVRQAFKNRADTPEGLGNPVHPLCDRNLAKGSAALTDVSRRANGATSEEVRR